MESSDDLDPAYAESYRLLPDLAKLREALKPLSPRHRIAFALGCCERLFPSYHALVKRVRAPDHLRPILDRLWQHVIGREMTNEEVAERQAACMSLLIGDEGCCEHVDAAGDAVDAVYVTLTACIEHSLDNVVRAAEVIRDNIDRPLWKEMAKEFTDGVGVEENRQIGNAIWQHPAMIAEIESEVAQLRFLYECVELTEEAIARYLAP